MQANQATLMWTMILCSVVLLGAVFWIGNSIPEASVIPDINVPTAAEIAAAVSAGIVMPEIPVTDNDKINEIHDEMFEDDMIRDYVKELISDEVESKDFTKSILEVLNEELNGSSFEVDSYRDITKIVLKTIDNSDINLKKGDETADVDFEVKVYYFVDDDEDETGKALISINLEIEDLDVDDELEDAEIVEYDDAEMHFEKFYTEEYR